MYKARYLYSELANTIQARRNCEERKDQSDTAALEWFDKWTDKLIAFERMLPSGAGFNNGTKLDLGASHAEKLVFHTSYHHMNENGFYDGWTDHTITVTPSFDSGFNLRTSGRDRNEVKDHIYETFDQALRQDITYELRVESFPEFTITSKWENQDGTASQCYMAWYVNGERFWNDYQGARDRAARLMTNTR